MKWILAVACCAIATPVVAQEIHRHRTAAGTFTAKSWERAESTEGRFSILMPAPFDDYTQESNTSAALHGYYLRAKLPDTTLFSALRAEYEDAKTAARICRKNRDENPWGATLKSRRTLKVEGRDAIEMTIDDGRLWMTMRVICLETEGMILQIASLAPNAAYAQSVAGKFFDSLKIRED